MPIDTACQLGFGMRKRDLRGKSPSTCMACRSLLFHHLSSDINSYHVQSTTPSLQWSDGEKPCKTYTSTGRTCQDYRSPPKSSSSSRSASFPSRAQFVSITAGPSSITNHVTTDQEHKTSTFFCENTIPHISSAFSDEF
jgi:hypothetical protein